MQLKFCFLKIYGLLFLSLGLLSSSLAQTLLQKQKLVNQTKELIAAYNSSDSAHYQAFIYRWTADEKRKNDFINQFNQEHADLGTVHINRIKVVSSTEAEALVQTNKYEAWWRVVVITDSLQRFKEHHMGLVRVTDEVLDTGLLTTAQIGNQIDSYIKSQAKFDTFKGNVFIERNGRSLYSKSFGTNTKGEANTFGQQFGLASMGKLFTAISILQLVKKGRLSLENTVGSLLPQLQNRKLANITIHQLLTHTSGMGDFFEDPDFQKRMDSTKSSATQVINNQLSETDAFLYFIEKDSLRFNPGSNWAYSNTGFELLGIILQKATGTSYKDYVKKHIFSAAGITASVPGSGSGGGLSTVSDLEKFSQALRTHLLLSPPLTTRFLTFRENDFYGYGSEHQVLGDEHIVGHSGGFENVCNELNIYQNTGYTVIILSNSNPPFGHFLSDKIKQLLIRKNEVTGNH